MQFGVGAFRVRPGCVVRPFTIPDWLSGFCLNLAALGATWVRYEAVHTFPDWSPGLYLKLGALRCGCVLGVCEVLHTIPDWLPGLYPNLGHRFAYWV